MPPAAPLDPVGPAAEGREEQGNGTKGGEHRWTATEDDAGQRLDVVICQHVPHLSRSRVQSLIEEGHAQLNGAPTKPKTKLRKGDLVTVVEPALKPVETLPEEIPLQILFEDEHIIVLNKPAGLVVHPGAGNTEHTLVNALLHHCTNLSGIGGELRPGIVHRLDKDTSGCIVAAKHDAAHQELSRQFAGRRVGKVYLAVVKGVLKQDTQEIEYLIQRDPNQRKRMQAVHSAKQSVNGTARKAHTTCTLLQAGQGMSLVKCRLHTGRTHQIRVHMAAIGHSLIGDTLYGGPARPSGTGSGQLLHAWRLGFTHPVNGQWLEFTASPPGELLASFPGVQLPDSESIRPGE